MGMELYYSLRSPFARRVRVALQRLAINYEARETDAFRPTEDFLQVNPLGFVPALRMTEGRQTWTLSDSDAILEHLHESHGERIWPRDLKTRARVRAASVQAVGLMTHTVNLFLESQRPQPDDTWRDDFQSAIVRTMDQLNETSVLELPWKVSDLQLTQAGYDLMIALEYMEVRLKGFDFRARYPQFAQFIDKHRNRGDLLPSAPPPS